MNQREKEEYLREYALLKAKGKPFFPYAVAKDSIMMMIVMAIIITMSITLGAELGPKADPTTTTYVPRPEWYFFFLFEVLRVIKPPELVPFATVGVPTICMIMLFLLPFIDRGPERRPERRPIATFTGILIIAAMGYLTYEGAAAGSPNSIDMKVASQYEAGKLVAAQSGCLACHKIGENGNDGPGPHLTDIGSKLEKGAIRRTLENPTAPMPSFANMPEDKKTALVNFLSSLRGDQQQSGVEDTGASGLDATGG
jgi:menaquinol-cytochrome c reductase cytochrome b/c subunit